MADNPIPCHEMAYHADEDRWYVCEAEMYTEHSHAEAVPPMWPAPRDVAAIIDKFDRVYMIEVK